MKVILFVLDSLRLDHVSYFGYDRKTTPNIDAVAEDGVAFSNAFAQGIWTCPSSGALLTSRYPTVHSALWPEQPLSKNSIPFANELREAGLTTACFSSTDWVSKERNYNRGYDEFNELFRDHGPHEPQFARNLTKVLTKWITNMHEEDFFLTVWSSGSHRPYTTPIDPKFGNIPDGKDVGTIPYIQGLGEERADLVKDLYDNNIYYNDIEFGRFVSQLKSLGIYEETLLVVTSDHGNVFDEHYRLEQSNPKLQHLLRRLLPKQVKMNYGILEPKARIGHQAIIPYDELLNVPLIVKFPGDKHAGSVSDDLVQSVDIGPTILESLGINKPSRLQGRSLIPLLKGEDSPNEFTYSTSTMLGGNVYYHSVRNDEFKYINIERTPIKWEDIKTQAARTIQSRLTRLLSGREHLFDVTADEKDNVINHQTEVRDLMRKEFERWEADNIAEINKDETESQFQISAEAKNRLEELGYIN